MNCPSVPCLSRKARYSEVSSRAAQRRLRITPLNRQCEPSINPTPALNWRVLGLLNLYRVLVPLVLLGLYSLGGARGTGVTSPQVFFGTAVFYLCFGLGNVILVRR